jgi:hypothetical protein
MTALASAAIAFSTTPAQAATFFYCGFDAPPGSSCVSDTDNVLLDNAENVMVGTGSVNGVPIEFRTTDADGIDLDASGQATIYSGTEDGVINNLTWELLSGAFSIAEFNLIDLGNVDFDVTIDSLLNGVVTTTSITYNATNNGNNRFGVLAGAGEVITGVTINSDTGFGSFKQLRIDLAQPTTPVPEPATWAMMLLGFGGVGMAMRRSRKRNGRLLQIA